MKYFKEPAQRVGWLFVLATAAGVLSVVVRSSTLGDHDLLSAVQANQGSLIFGNLLIFVMLSAMVGTAVLLFPILREHSETLALSYVLSVWGLIGVPLMFASGLLVMFESLNSNASTLNLLVVPLAVQEMVMALWLIVKGFSNVSEHDPALEAPGQLAASR